MTNRTLFVHLTESRSCSAPTRRPKPLGTGPVALEILNLQTRRSSAVPGSEGFRSPQWSPDGRYISAYTSDAEKLMLFDLKAQKWTELACIPVAYAEWSHNGDYIYLMRTAPASARGIFRLRVRDRKLEQVASLKDFRQAPGIGSWAGLTPDDSPLLMRDAGTQDVYALDWDTP